MNRNLVFIFHLYFSLIKTPPNDFTIFSLIIGILNVSNAINKYEQV